MQGSEIVREYEGDEPMYGKDANDEMRRVIVEWHMNANLGLLPYLDQIVIEKVESFGMAVGAEVFETVYWSGRFAEAAYPIPVERIGRKAVKMHLCGSMRAKDANIRQALIDRYGGPDAIGKKASPGPLYGISGDVWSALAVAVTYSDGLATGKEGVA